MNRFVASFLSPLRHFSTECIKKRISIGRLINSNVSRDAVKNAKPSQTVQHKNSSVYPVVAACTAESYDFSTMLPFLQKNFFLSPFICDEVLHVQIPSRRGEVFFFKNGSLVFWSNQDSEVNSEGLLRELKSSLLPSISSFEISPFKEPDFEELSYKISNVPSGIVDEVILLNEECSASVKEKLAFSNGLADSVKLGVLERMMDDHIEKVRNIPSSLISGGLVGLGRKEMLSLTGELLHFRAQLNLNSDLIDTPELYWSEPKLEDLYIKISRVLETRRRTATLNKKLDYAKEMAQVLSDHLAEKHGLKLEWGIIALIAVEVAFETVHLLEKFIF